MTATATQLSDSELGRILLSLRGVQWVIGTKNDPYALLLRAASDDPNALGTRIREQGALYRSSADAWVTGHYQVAAAALRDPRLSARPAGSDDADPPEDGTAGSAAPDADPMPWDVPALRDVLPPDRAFLALERSHIDRLRRLLQKLPIDQYQPETTGIYRRNLRRHAGEFDLMTDVALPSAIDAACDLLGLSTHERERFAELVGGAVCALDAILCPPQLKTAKGLIASIDGIRELLTASIADKRRSSGEGLIAELLRATDEPDEVLAVCVLLAVSGVTVSADLVCNAMAVLLDHPEHWKDLCEEPGRAADVVEETLRYAPPIRLRQLFAREDVELGGQEIATGEEIIVAVAAANRDPEVFRDPERFDPTRFAHENAEAGTTPTAHLSLHRETETGLLAPVIRAHAISAIRLIATEAPTVRRTGPVLRRLRSPVTGGVLRFPVATR